MELKTHTYCRLDRTAMKCRLPGPGYSGALCRKYPDGVARDTAGPWQFVARSPHQKNYSMLKQE
jgi:hypothetical protein